jgi:hypothetical protein
MPTPTTTYALSKPTVGGDDNAWGTELNSALDKIDDLFDGTTAIKPNLDAGLWKVGGVAVTSTAAELNILDGVTASTAELNILDGVTASTAELNILDGVTSTAAELNILDGVTATTAELNFVDGVTSNIQTQFTAKANLDSPALTGTPTAPTATAGTNTTQLATTAFVQGAAYPTYATNQATTSGTAFDFTGLPSTVSEIEVHFQAVSLNASGNQLVQLIVSGTPLTTGYVSSSGTSGAENSTTTGFIVFGSSAAQDVSGSMRLVQVATGIWVESHSVSLGSADANGGGFIGGVGTVTGIRLTRTGTASFDNGNVTISYR